LTSQPASANLKVSQYPNDTELHSKAPPRGCPGGAAFFKNGQYVQAFPSFGAERRGAPVSAFVRVDSAEMTLRCNVYRADWIVLLDAQLLGNSALVSSLKEGGSLLINGTAVPESFEEPPKTGIFLVDARAISLRLRLGNPLSPIMNTAMTGAFARVSALVPLDSVIEAIREMAPVEKERNAAAAREAYEAVKQITRTQTGKGPL